MLRLKYQLVCDDVRIENNNKILVVGMYLDNVVVQALPTVLQPLTFLHVFDSDRVGLFRLLVQLVGPEGTIGDPITVELDIKQPGVVAGIIKMNVQVNTAGTYLIRGSGDGVLSFEQAFNVILPPGKA